MVATGELKFTESGHVKECSSMVATGAYGERMAHYLHLADPPIGETKISQSSTAMVLQARFTSRICPAIPYFT
jgi:hypothetical protein